MPLPIKFTDQLLKRVGHVWSSRALDVGRGEEWGILMGHGGNGSNREGETEKSSVKSLLYSKRKSDDKGLQINIAHAVFPSSEICEVERSGPLRPM